MAKYSSEYKNLQPYVVEDIRKVVNATGLGTGSSSVTGVTDHGALTGLADDDHPQYLTPVRGDARYIPSTRQVIAGDGLTGGGALSADITLTVGVSGLGLGVGADAVTLTSSSSPGAAASILASSAAGLLTLYNGAFTQAAASAATFASGFAGSGWRADYGITTASKATIECDDLTVRGRMRVYELMIQQIRATNGSLLVSSASRVVSVSSSSNPLWTVNGSQLKFNGSNATLTTTLYTITTVKTDGATDTDGGSIDRRLYHGFLVGDLIRAQQVRWNGSEFGGVVQSNLEVTGVTNLYTYQGTFVSGDAPAVSYDFVRLGSASDTTRQGVVYLTSDDSAAPFIDIADGITSHSAWNSAGAIKVRLGKLTGISDSVFGGALSGYGLYASNVYLRGNIYATSGRFSGEVVANSGSIEGVLSIGANGGFYQGTGTSGSPGTGLKIWSSSGVGLIGAYNAGDLQWFNSTNGYLYAGRVDSASTAMGYDVWGVRFARDGIRLLAEASDSFIQNTSVSSIKWVYNNTYDIDRAFTTALNFSSIYAYNATTAGHVYTGMTTMVGSDNYTIKDAVIYLSAQHYTGSVYKGVDFTLTCVRSTGATRAWCNADEFQIDKAIKLAEMTAPAAPDNSRVFIYAEDAGGGKTKLMAKFPTGAAQQLAVEP